VKKKDLKSTILITGADGFIGSHLCEYLISLNYRVKAFVYYNSFGSWGWLDNAYKNLPMNLEIVMGDISNPLGFFNWDSIFL
jgi:dTDP-glucose 4,6-dehydratase